MPAYESALTDELRATTDLAAPTLESVSTDATSADLGWTATHSNGETRTEYRESGSSTWTSGPTVSRGTETATINGLKNGITYEFRVVATTPDADSPSNSLTDTTTLPDEDQPVLGNGVEDEVAIDRESAPTNNGSVRLQIRETGESAWDESAVGFAEQTVAYDTLTTQFVGREDGEEYEVRARSETQDATGAWTSPVSIKTKFPGAVNLTATALSPTEVDLTWIDQADNELGQEVVRERRGPDGEWWPERVVDDAGPNTEMFVDDTAQPDHEYRYRIRAFTDDTAADSNTDTATTADIGLSRRRIPASGWYVEIETDAGDILRPTILTESQPRPQLNDVPEVELALPSDERWLDESLDRATLRVWRDGDRLPISRVEIPEDSSTRATLIGRGGIALDEVVARDVDDLVSTHEFVDELLTELDIPHVVDDPASDTRADVPVLGSTSRAQAYDTFVDLDTVRNNPVPARVNSDGSVELVQSCWIRASAFADGGNATIEEVDPPDGTRWGGRSHALVESGDSKEWDFDINYEWPASQARPGFRCYPLDGEHPSFEVRLNGQTVDEFPANSLLDSDEPTWTDFFTGPAFDDVTFEPPEVTLEVVATGSQDGKVIFDGAGLYDDGFSDGISWGSNGTSSIDSNNNIGGPPVFTNSLELETKDVGTIEQVVGGSIDADFDSTANGQALAVSNDGGETWQETANSETVDTDFATGSTQLRGRVTLSRYTSDPNSSPTSGDTGQTVSNFQLAADLNDTPFLEVESFEDSVAGLLTTLANRQRFAWEVQSPDKHPGLDAGGDDPGVVVFTQLGQREASTKAPVLDYEVRRDSSTVVDTVIAYGPSRRVEDERVVLTGEQFVGIGDDYLQPGRTRVYQPGTDGDPDTVYDSDEDYRLLRNEGSIARREGSAIADGEEVHIDYETRRRVEYTLPGADGSGDTIRETFENAVTLRALQQAALFTAKRLSSPQRQATVELARDDLGYQLVDALSVADVPGLDEPRRIANVDVQTDRMSADLGEKQSAGDVVDSINRRLSGLAERL